MNRWTIGLIIIVGLGLLVAGGLTAVKLLNQDEGETAVAAGGGRVIQSVAVAEGGAPVAVQTTILPAAELPTEPAAASGILVRREDNSLTVGTGGIEVNVEVAVDGDTGQETVQAVPRATGPELEVVVGRNTTLYLDVTDYSMGDAPESGERTVQQQVRPVDSLEDLPENAEIQAWGNRSGDRITADVLVFGTLPLPGN
ncbi:MAG: hypothetical protein KC423_04405 [Anaerolineales bacterium]|nr:hypothetical protein [Anaerolineales bacterium]MCB9431801.1 hypothetical protein [Ardenticatenaceae bacterium]